MIVYFVRHGQSEANRREMNAGWAPTPLSELGHAQARAANAYLKDIPFDKVFCSDLVRTQQTCDDALPGNHKILSDKIREIGVGTLAGRYIADNAAEYGKAYEDACRDQDFSAWGGEKQSEIKERIYSFIRDDLEPLEGTCDYVAVFGHEGTVHQMMSYCFGCDLLLEHMVIKNASASVFEFKNGCWSLLQFCYAGDWQPGK